MGLVLIPIMVSSYLLRTVIDPWVASSGIPIENLRISMMPRPQATANILILYLNCALNPLLVSASIPMLYISLFAYEDIPLSRAQRSSARLTRRISLAVIPYLLLLSTLYLIADGTGSERLMKVFYALAFPSNILTIAFCYGSLIAWTLHVLQTKVLKSNPVIRRASRVALSVTLAGLLLIIFQEGVRLFRIELPPVLDIIAANGDFRLFYAPWLLGGTWGIAGIVVLLRMAPGTKAVMAEIEQARSAKDPATVPLPGREEILRIFVSRGLSEREAEVAAMVLNGAGNKEIAQALDISYNTVRNHVSRIFRKLGAGNRFELIRSVRLSGPAVSPLGPMG
jgi:DNA-binding CsgD family transcriptional regulator